MKALFAGALCAAVVTTAHAQSAVTLYGMLDVGITALSNDGGHRTAVMDSGVLVPNLFGLKGSEDLGGGTRAVFQLEGQFEVGTGAPMGTCSAARPGSASTMRAGARSRSATSTNSCSCRCRCGGSGRNCRMCR